MEWRTTGSGEIAMPQQGWHANISFAGPAAELVYEVISLSRILVPESNAKNSFRESDAHSPLDVAPAQLKRFSPRLAALVCKSPARYENIQGLHIHTDSY
jgi:hypothetical protein